MIQLRKEYFQELTKEKLKYLSDTAKPYLQHRKELFNRYNRKDSPNDLMSNGDKVFIAFEYYITVIAQGYIAGKAPKFSVKNGENSSEFQDAIENIRRYNDDATLFIELMHDYLISAAAYLFVYENERNEIVYARFDSRQTVCIYDYGTPPYPVACLRFWDEKDGNKEIKAVEIITDKYRAVYKNNELFEMQELHWGDVPVAVFENTDNIAIFEPANSLIDTYENLVTNIKNMTKYNDEAKLKVVGYSPQNPDAVIEDENGNFIPNPARKAEEEQLYKAQALFLDPDGDISWLLKNVDYSGILSILKQLHDLITMLTGVPNMTDEAFSNADNASALGYKLYALDQYSSVADRIFKKGYLRLWEIITNRLNTFKGRNFDFRDIDITFNRNIPTDKDKSINRAVAAYNGGISSLQTAINLSDIEVVAEDEISRIRSDEAYKRQSMIDNYEPGQDIEA